MKVTEIAFSCYAVKNMAAAREFYEGGLGLKPATAFGENWVEYEIGPHTLALGCGEGFAPSPDGCAVALEVENFEEAVAELKARGTKFRIEGWDGPICKMAAVFDPDGNSVFIHKRKTG